MANTNGLVNFFRHYGPIAASDNMYDELIQAEIERYNISDPIHILPSTMKKVVENLELENSESIVLTGTAGDGKTFHCRRVFEHFSDSPKDWQRGEKISSVTLSGSGKKLNIVKDLSELTQNEKDDLLPRLSRAISGDNQEEIFLIAANDGQLLATWRDWAEKNGANANSIFKEIERMLVDDETNSDHLSLKMYNLSRQDASSHFEAIVQQLVEHPQWEDCNGCELMSDDGSSKCPIRINRELLRGGAENSIFRQRLSELLKLSGANRTHLPIRDLLLLGVNILLGDRKSQGLLTCKSAKNRVRQDQYRYTNPYSNVFGSNLPERQRQQYQAFSALEAFGVGKETDNKIDNLLIYGPYNDSDIYMKLVGGDPYYGGSAYNQYLRDYLEGERENTREFMLALTRQRQRLFFTLPNNGDLSPWSLSVYQSAHRFLEFSELIGKGVDAKKIKADLVRGLNRTFCGMMIDDGSTLYLTSSGGDGRGRIASILEFELGVTRHRRNPFLHFSIGKDGLTPCIRIIDPAGKPEEVVEELELQLTHFEYLVRVARGSLPASFSRQCYEDFLDFKLRVVERIERLIGAEKNSGEVSLQAITVDERGRPQPDSIRILVGEL